MKKPTARDIDTKDDQTLDLEGGLSLRIQAERDDHMEPPWENSDGHGPVSEWRPKNSKGPHERILCDDRNMARFYDWRAAVEMARRDGWGFLPGKLEHGRFHPDDPKRLGGWARCGAYYAENAENFNAAILSVYAQHRATMTAGEYAAAAAEKDFQFLRDWCLDRWEYLVVTVTLLDADGREIDSESCGGIESAGDWWREMAAEMAGNIIDSYDAEAAEAQAWAERDVVTKEARA